MSRPFVKIIDGSKRIMYNPFGVRLERAMRIELMKSQVGSRDFCH